MYFTEEEFGTMVEEVLYERPARFDTFAEIVQKTAYPHIVTQCRGYSCLRGGQHEGDILTLVQMKLIKVVVPQFLLKNGPEGEVNYDPNGLKNWILKCVKTTVQDYAEKVIRRIAAPMPENEEEDQGVDPDDRLEKTDELRKIFSDVFEMNMSVYKTLTWLAAHVLMLVKGMPYTDVNRYMDEFFAERTLYEIYMIIKMASKAIPWLEITGAQTEKMLADLRKMHESGVIYGEMQYKDFYIMRGGKPDGVRSVGNWVSDINRKLRQNRKRDENA